MTMAIPKTREDMNVEWFNRVLQPRGIVVSNVNWEGAANNGLGALSSLERVQLTLQNGSGISVIIKTLPTDPNVRAFAISLGFVSREVNMYTRVFPDMENFMNERNVSTEFQFCHPICYYGTEEQNGEEYNMILILEDLIASKFEFWKEGPFEQLDWERTSAALRQIALFHAVSLAYRTVHGISNYRDIYPFLTDFTKNEASLDGYLTGGLKIIEEKIFQVMESKGEIVPPSLRETLEKYKGQLMGFLKESLVPDPKRISTICHGDLHSHNISFSPKNGKRMEACWFDFQACFDGPPMKDVTLFLLLCCDFSLSSIKLDEILGVYHAAFSDIIEKLGVNVSYPLQQMKMDFKKCTFLSTWHIISMTQFFGVREEFLQSLKKLLLGVYELGWFQPPAWDT